MNHLRRLPAIPRRILPNSLNFNRHADVLEHMRTMLDADLSTLEDLEDWLTERKEFSKAFNEGLLLAMLDFGDQVGDSFRQEWFCGFRRDLMPEMSQLEHLMDELYLASPARAGLPEAQRKAQDMACRGRSKLYRETNLMLHQRLGELETEYVQIMGNLHTNWGGQERSLASLSEELSDPDEMVRQKAWEAKVDALLPVMPMLEDLLDETLALREQIARNGDCETWLDYLQGQGRPTRAWQDLELPGFDPFPEPPDVKPGSLAPWNLNRAGLDTDPFFKRDLELTELHPFIYKHAPEIGQSFFQLRKKKLVDTAPRMGKFDFDGCLWLPEHRLPFIRQSASNLGEDLCRFLRTIVTAHRSMAGSMSADDSSPVQPLRPLDHVVGVRMSQGYLREFDPQAAKTKLRHFRQRQRVELLEDKTAESWSWWIHTFQGASRDERHKAYIDRLHSALPGLRHQEDEILTALSYFHAPIFLSNWDPPVDSVVLSEGWKLMNQFPTLESALEEMHRQDN